MISDGANLNETFSYIYNECILIDKESPAYQGHQTEKRQKRMNAAFHTPRKFPNISTTIYFFGFGGLYQ